MAIVYPLYVNHSIDIHHEISSHYFIWLKGAMLDDWDDDNVLGAGVTVMRGICASTATTTQHL